MPYHRIKNESTEALLTELLTIQQMEAKLQRFTKSGFKRQCRIVNEITLRTGEKLTDQQIENTIA